MAKKKPTAKKASTAKQTHTPAYAATSEPAQKRPATNSPIPPEVIDSVANLLREVRSKLEPYAAHLRPLDRRRLNCVGIKRQGFIESAYEFVMKIPEFLPHYLTQERFNEEHEYATRVRSLYGLNKQNDEFLHNITAQAENADYTNSLDYYAAVREATVRRVNGAETVFNSLEPIFLSKKSTGGKLTAKKIKSDFSAISQGKRNGMVAVINEKPKLTGGKHKVIDERFEDSAKFQDTEEGEIGSGVRGSGTGEKRNEE